MFKNKRVIHIVATDALWGIGKEGGIPWHLPKDLKHFKAKTEGHVVLMGRKTVESLPKKLSNRTVIEVSMSKGVSLISALNKAVIESDKLGTDCIFIAGGGEIYKLTQDICDEAMITNIIDCFHCDTKYTFPFESGGFKTISSSEGAFDGKKKDGSVIETEYTHLTRMTKVD